MNSITNIQNKLYTFGSDLVGNRVFDLYLKYMGIKTLTTATLVPIGLISGKEYILDFMRISKQKGGSFLKELPILDDPLVGNYLKLAGLSAIQLTSTTLIPLGILMFIYDINQTNLNQDGGSLNNYVKTIWGNRVLDLFAKYQGLKILTSSTLVPFSLLLGKELFEKFITEQKGGNILSNKYPFIDDPLLGNYLKLAGLSAMELTSGTLVPLGIISMLYHVYLE
tara:strand:- start:693 stop:1364 length:672 start_codon:yes stop_codon:yes gene_type:complete